MYENQEMTGCVACGSTVKHSDAVEIDMGYICKECSEIGSTEHGRTSKLSN
jgi:hypothetical protein